jgi:hypothetical protein
MSSRLQFNTIQYYCNMLTNTPLDFYEQAKQPYSRAKNKFYRCAAARVSFETSFDSKQPKLEPKLVSALSETKRLFRLFRFYTKTESFDVSIEPKQTKDQPKQFDREHILKFFTKFIVFWVFSVFFGFFLGFFGFFLGFSGLFRNSLFRCFGCFASIPKQRVSIDPKQTEGPPKQFKREYIWVFFKKFRVVSVCYETVLFVSI